MNASNKKERLQRRLQNKKRKAEAFLQLAELNDKEGRHGAHEAVVDDSKAGKERLEGQEYDELRKRLRKRKQILSSQPNFLLKKAGLDATLDLPENLRTPLFVRDVQSLILSTLLGPSAPVQPGRWSKFQQLSKVCGITLLVIDGPGLKDAEDVKGDLKCLEHKLAVISPLSYGSNIHHELSVLPLSHQHQKRLTSWERQGKVNHGRDFLVYKTAFPVVNKVPELEIRSDDVPLVLRLILTMEQLIDGAFPLPVATRLNQAQFKDFVFTCDQYQPVTPNSPVLSIDCEMCVTVSGMHELAQISVVDVNGSVVYSTLVKPDNEIKNYLTKFNGITEETLSDVNVRLRDVQEKIRELVGPDTILVGHSLDSDLRAMNMFHPYIVDTSVIYNLSGDRSRKPKLKDLAEVFLNKIIQTGTHDANEDAKVAMELVQLKLQKGYQYGDVCLSNVVFDRPTNADSVITASTVFHCLQKANKSVKISGQSGRISGYKDFISEHVTMEESEDAIEGVSNSCRSSDFTLCHCQAKDPSTAAALVQGGFEKLPYNHVFATLWCGNAKDQLFFGVSVRKRPLEELLKEIDS